MEFDCKVTYLINESTQRELLGQTGQPFTRKQSEVIKVPESILPYCKIHSNGTASLELDSDWITLSAHSRQQIEPIQFDHLLNTANIEDALNDFHAYLAEKRAEIKAKEQEAEKLRAERDERRTAQEEIARAEREAQRNIEKTAEQARIDALKSWALESGSERVKLMISEGFSTWNKIAREEWDVANCPEGFIHEDDEPAIVKQHLKGLREQYRPDPRTMPSLAELQELKSARENGFPCELLWADWRGDSGEKLTCGVLQITVARPDETTVNFWKYFDETAKISEE